MKKWTDNKIGDEGVNKISESLMKNTTLTTLYLSDVIGKENEWNRMKKQNEKYEIMM